MQLTAKTLGVTFVALVAVVGVAAASPLAGVAVADDGSMTQITEEDRPLNGTNSPWMADDDRLDRFQDRFDLTDEQVDEIQSAVTDQIEAGADRTEIRSTVTAMLTEYGVDEPELGPPADAQDRLGLADGQGTGPADGQQSGPTDGTGYQHGNGASSTGGSQQGFGHGQQGQSNGPHGPADGSCLN
ncbi:MAG: hypothetical protein V5A34_00820 [Halapricum sp.]